MTLLDNMVTHVLNGETSFVLKGKGWYYHFMTYFVGKALYIYTNRMYNEKDIGNVSNDYKLAAIQTQDGKFYIVDEYMFGLWEQKVNEMNPLCTTLETYTSEINEYIKNELYKKFYNEIEIGDDDISDDIVQRCKKEARERLICSMPEKEAVCSKSYFCSLDDAAQVLNGTSTVESILKEKIIKDQTLIISQKRYISMVNKFMRNSNEIVSESEMELARSINQISAKYVNIEFTVGDKVSVAKIDPQYILSNMSSKDVFRYWDFKTYYAGKHLMEKLGLDSVMSCTLTCDHISKITYGKQTLYQK